MKLKVENLAKINEAEVEVKNLTLFIGQNSTNKSYMAHVIYELLSFLNSYEEKEQNDKLSSKVITKNFKKSQFILKNIVSETYVGETNSEYTTIIFEMKNENINNLLNNLYEDIIKAITKKINDSFHNNSDIIQSIGVLLNLNKLFDSEQFEIRIHKKIEKIDEELIVFYFLNNIITVIMRELKEQLANYYDIQYFPASRSGFMLAFDEIVAGLIRDKYKGQTSSAKLTKPTIDFITNYSDIRTQKFNIKDAWKVGFNLNTDSDVIEQKLVDFLQNNIMKAFIKEDKSNEDYSNYYLETENNIKLDLHLASSSILEIMPFVVFLQNNTNIKKTFFVIEEPEAHLHPKAQIQMARFIVMLTNTGAKVLVTTHSDYILGEINNCIKKFELQEDDISISKDDVSAYLFKNNKNETEVKELEIDKFGISDENFEEALDELLEESGNLTDRILDNE